MQPSASPSAASPLNQAFDLPKSASSSFRPFSKLFRVKSAPPQSNQSLVSSESSVDVSRTDFLRFPSDPPTSTFPPTTFSCSSKNSPRKSSVPADLSSQSFNPCTASRPRGLTHSLSTPTLGDSRPSYPLTAPPHMAKVSPRCSHLSVITQDLVGGRILDAETDDTPLVASKCPRKIWNSKWKQRTIFKSKSTISSSSYPAVNPSTSTLGSVQLTGTSLRSESTQSSLPTISCFELPNLIPPLSSSCSSAADDLPSTPSSGSGSTLSFQSQQPAVRGRGSIAKLARTLGVLPAELDYPTQFGELPASAGFAQESFSDDLDTHPHAPGRMSLSLSSLPSLSFFRFSSLNRRTFTNIPSQSHALMPTQSTEELQKFTFAHNLTNPHTSTSYDSPISPITFEPSTPTVMWPVQLPSDKMKHKGGMPQDQSRGAMTSIASSLSRARTLSRTEDRSSFEAKARGDIPFQDLLPEKANRLNDPPVVPQEPRNRKTSKRNHESTKTRSGQWNQDDMQYVMKRLRSLK